MPITQFGEGATKYIFPMTLQSYSDNFGDLVPSTQRLPGVDGGFDLYGDDPAPAEVGSVRLGYTLIATSRSGMDDLRDAVAAMKAWGKQRLFMQPTDPADAIRWTWAKVNNIQMAQEPSLHTDLWQPVTVIWQCADPAWYGRGTEGKLWGEMVWGTDKWGGAAAFQAGSGQITNLADSVNNGNAISLPRITIRCSAGQTATNPIIERVVSGVVKDRITYTGVLIAGDELVIDCRNVSVKKNGVGVYASIAAQHPDWMRLLPGSNSLRVKFSYTTDAAGVRVTWYDVWR